MKIKLTLRNFVHRRQRRDWPFHHYTCWIFSYCLFLLFVLFGFVGNLGNWLVLKGLIQLFTTKQKSINWWDSAKLQDGFQYHFLWLRLQIIVAQVPLLLLSGWIELLNMLFQTEHLLECQKFLVYLQLKSQHSQIILLFSWWAYQENLFCCEMNQERWCVLNIDLDTSIPREEHTKLKCVDQRLLSNSFGWFPWALE